MLLIDVAIRAALILLAALVTTSILRRAAAATRHLVWTLAVVGVLALPAAMAMLPEWHILPGINREAIASTARATLGTTPQHAALPENAVAISRSTTSNLRVSRAPWPLGAADLALMLWALVTCGLLVRILAGIEAVRRLGRHARPADARCRAVLDDVMASAGMTTPIRLLVSADVAVPMTWGAPPPLLLLPADVYDWSDDRLRMVLFHEVAHIRRGDWLTHALGRAVTACHWFNPLAWIALRAMTRERERACDDYVLARGEAATDYAQHVLEIARGDRLDAVWTMAPAMARRSELEGRLLSILTPHHRETRRYVAPTLTLTASAVGLFLASAAPVAAPIAVPQVALQERPVNSAARPSAALLENTVAERQEVREDRAVRKALVGALEDSSDDVREKAALGLALRAGADVVPPLLHALKDPSPQVREKAAIGLAFRRQPEVLEALLEAVHDTDAQVREKVVFALSVSGDPRAVPALTAATKDPDQQVREKAVQGLGLVSTAGDLISRIDGDGIREAVRDGVSGALSALMRR